MNWQSLTALVIVGLIVFGIVYDLIAYAVAGNDATISVTCFRIASERPGFALAFVFALGILCGHLFLPQHVQSPPR